MKRTLFVLVLAILCATPLLALPAHALTRQTTHATPAKPATHTQAVTLGPMVVTGLRLRTLPLPVKLQIIKAALNRPVNFRHENLSKLVCRFYNRDPRYAMKHPLFCETNCDILKAQNAFAHISASCDVGDSAEFNERLAAFINSHHFNRSQLKALLKKLPPPGSSYTFQVKSHGKVVARWEIEDGQVVKVKVRKKRPD